MKKIFIALLYLFVSTFAVFSVNAYQYQLRWNGMKSIAIDSARIELIDLKDAVYISHVPYAQIEIPVKSGMQSKFEIKNVALAELTDAERTNLQFHNLNFTEDVSLSLQKKSDNYILRFLPFVSENGIVKKVISFDIEENLTQNSSFTQSAPTMQHTHNSAMRQGSWVKMRVAESGVYKLTYNDIVSAGINPDDLHIYGYGGALQNEDISADHYDDLPQCPYAIFKGADGVFGDGDYVLFYAQGPISWNYYSITKEFQRIKNYYSNYGYYFLASGVDEAPMVIEKVSAVSVPESETPTQIRSFVDHYLYEKDMVNLAESGREFYGEEFSNSVTSKELSFFVPNVDVMTNMVLRVNTAVKSSTSNGSLSNILARVGRLNDASGNVEYTFKANNILPSDYYTKGVEVGGIFYGMYNFSEMIVPVTIKFKSAIASARAYLNYVTLTATRDLTMYGDQMQFRVPTFTSGYANFQMNNSSDSYQIWDITEPTKVKEVSTDFAGGVTSFVAQNTDGKIQEYVAVNPNGTFNKPEIIGAVANQNIHSHENPSLVIITNEEYLDAANKVAEAHRKVDNMKVEVVTLDQVYNEFSSGTPDASAYRWLMKMFYDRYQNKQDATETKYLLLYGDGTFDNCQVNGDGHNKVLTYQSYASLSEVESYIIEDYFGFMDDAGSGDIFTSTATVDVGVGRITAHDKSVADDVANKIVNYINNKSLGKWKNQLLFFGDDGGSGDGIRHEKQCDSVACRVSNLYPDFQVTKLYLDAFTQQTSASGESYPEAKEKFWKMIKSGVLYMNYVGHGGVDALTNEKIVTNADILALHNDNLAFWTTATCNFSRFDSPTVSAGENVLFNSKGGGIGLFSTTRTVYSDPNYALNKEFVVPLLAKDENGNQYRLGDLVKYAKNNCTSKMYDNKLSFVLLGDPALRLAIPQYDVVTETINGKGVQEASVGALDEVTIVGYVANKGQIMTDFNGTVFVTVFDKTANIKTLDNHGEGAYVYVDRSSIFSGKATVIDGRFTVQMMLPKDINYSFGDGKVVYYAMDETNRYEANGYDLFTVGGCSSATFDDEEGPTLSVYLNTPTFKSGDVVAPNPILIANVNDENGINISGVGIGHDIAIKIDDDEWIVLNDYYESNMGTFRSGVVKYTLPDLAEGQHSLTFRVWDLLNNSSTETIEFTISEKEPIGIDEVFCYPNPVKGKVVFAFRHNRPESEIYATLRIFDFTGRKMYEQGVDIYADYNEDGNLATIATLDIEELGWDNGIYLYSVELDSEVGKSVTKTKKMIIAK